MKKITTLIVFAFIGIYSYSQLAWLQMPDFPGTGIRGCASFSISGKGYMGLGNDSVGGYPTNWYEYDPVGNAWTAKANFPGTPRVVAVSFVINGKGYITTGQCPTGFTGSGELWQYDPVGNSWAQKAAFPGVSRMNAVGFSINGKGYVGSGFTGGANTNTFYEYDPVGDSWTQKTDFPGLARNGAVAFSAGNKGYTGMGIAANSTANYTDFYEYNPSNNSWTAKADAPFPWINNSITYSSATVGYVLCGYSYQYSGITHNPTNLLWKYDPTTDQWTLPGTFIGLPRGYASGFTINNDIYIAGGGQANSLSVGVVLHDLWKLSDGLTTLIEPGEPNNGFRIFPNPTNDLIFLHSDIAGELIEKIRVYDVQGKLISSKQVERSTASVDVSALSKGMYFIEAITSGSKVLDGKFVKQ